MVSTQDSFFFSFPFGAQLHVGRIKCPIAGVVSPGPLGTRVFNLPENLLAIYLRNNQGVSK
jgi:hypothetical protein